MADIIQKEGLPLDSKGIEVEEAMTDTRSRSETEYEAGIKRGEFEETEPVVYTGEDNKSKEAEPAAEEPVEEPVEEAAEDGAVDDNLLELRKMMGMETKAEKKKADEAPPEPEVEPEPEPEPEEEVEEKKEEPKAKKAVRVERREPPDMEDMARMAGQAAAEAVKASRETGEVEAVQETRPGLDDEDTHSYEVFNHMEKLNPDKYKGLKDRFARFVEQSREYQRKWVQDNPDSVFNVEDEEHAEFFQKNEPKYAQSDFSKSERRIDMEDVVQDVEKKYSQKIEDLEEKLQRKRAAEPAAEQMANSAIVDLVEAISPELRKALDEGGPEAAEKQDPLLYDHVDKAANSLSAMVYEIAQNNESGLFNGRNNEIHNAIGEFLMGREDYINSLPASSRVWNGRRFATNKEYGRMSKADRKSHWTIDSNLLKTELVKHFSTTVKGEVEKTKAMLSRYGATKGSQTKGKRKAGTTSKPASPEATSQGATAPNLTTGSEEISTPEKELANLMWG